jgi:hypothetical protein
MERCDVGLYGIGQEDSFQSLIGGGVFTLEVEETKESIANEEETIMSKSEAEKESESTAGIILRDFEVTASRATRIAEEVAQKLSSVSFPDNLVKQEECEVIRRYPALFEALQDHRTKIDDALSKIESVMKRCEL